MRRFSSIAGQAGAPLSATRKGRRAGGQHDFDSDSDSDSGSEIEEASESDDDDEPTGQLSVRVGVIGAPNAGKSVLTNTFVGSKVSAVSNKTNTTQRETLGILTQDKTQVLFYDTPGVVDSRHVKTNMQRARVRGAWGTAIDCDCLIFLVDAHRQVHKPDPRIPRLLRSIDPGLQQHTTMWADREHIPKALVLNKVDLFPAEDRKLLDRLRAELERLHDFDRTFVISAKYKTGTADLLQYVMENATERDWSMPEDMTTDQGPEHLAIEIVREEIFRRLHQELPYVVEIYPVSYSETKEVVKIEQEVVVETRNQARTVIGTGGAVINAIRDGAAKTLEKTFNRPVRLKLKVRPKKR